jgi:hypothetical protein
MKQFKRYKDIPKDFTETCKITWDNSICYFKNGKFHREDGPAIEYENGEKHWLVNGLFHREDGPAIEFVNGRKSWYYKDKCYGNDNTFTVESWKEKVKQLKREEELKVFI